MKSRSTASTNLTKVKQAILFRRFLGASVVGMAVFVMAFTLVPYIMAEANATTADAHVTWNEVSLTLDPDLAATQAAVDPDAERQSSTHGDVNFGELVPSAVGDGNFGTMRVLKKTIGITTNANYYSVYLSMVGDSNSLELTDSALEILPINAYWDGATDGDPNTNAPMAFSSTAWGFAVPTGSVAAGTMVTPFTFDYSSAYDLVTESMTKATYASVYNTGTWAQVPVAGQAQQIWRAEYQGTGSSGFGETSFPIYYAVMVDNATIAGTYANQIVYTALASSGSLDEVSKNIKRDEKYVYTGGKETLEVDLSGVGLTRDDVEIYLVPHAVMDAHKDTTTNEYALGSWADVYKTNANKCVPGELGTDFVLTNRGLTIRCVMPESPNGVDDGTQASTDWEMANGQQKGEFDIWLRLERYGYDYVSHYTQNAGNATVNVASVIYAGLQSKDASGNKYVSTMQDMMTGVCKNTNIWGDKTGADARLYGPLKNDGTRDQVVADVVTTDPDTDELIVDGAATATASAALDKGTFALTDVRDSKQYLVRHLADDNCWMVQNLDLELANFAGKKTVAAGALTPANTDLSYGLKSTDDGYVDHWDPTESVRTKIETTYVAALSGDQSLGVNFGGLTKYVLGIKQEKSGLTEAQAQYQPKGTSGADWYWGSKCSEPGNCELTSVTNNANADIPRSYANDYDYQGLAEAYADGSMGGTKYDAGGDASWSANHASTYYGHYYNWYAATAESGKYSTPGGTTVKNSICPSGWQLPVNGGDGVDKSWQKLVFGTYKDTAGNNGANNGTTSAAMRQVPLSLVFTGYYNWTSGTARNYAGSYGYFWSSTAYSGTNAYYLSFSGSNVYPQNDYYGKPVGLPVRCVAR